MRLSQLVSAEVYGPLAERQLDFLASDARQYPAGYGMFLLALLDRHDPPPKVTAVVILWEPGANYPMKNGKTTFYICRGHSCLPPVNELPEP